MASLLAVDLGLATGLALYGPDGRLIRYRSTRFPNVGVLKGALPKVIAELATPEPIGWVVVEGDRHLADIWHRQSEHIGAMFMRTSAEEWRMRLLLERDREHGTERAKAAADTLARRIISWSSAPKPTSLRHDVAEAICIGLWAALQTGLLAKMPTM